MKKLLMIILTVTFIICGCNSDNKHTPQTERNFSYINDTDSEEVYQESFSDLIETIDEMEYFYKDSEIFVHLFSDEFKNKNIMIIISSDNKKSDFAKLCYMQTSIQCLALDENINCLVILSLPDKESVLTIRNNTDILKMQSVDTEEISGSEEITDNIVKFSNQLEVFFSENNMK